MKRFNILLVFLVLFFACKEEKKEAPEQNGKNVTENYQGFGEKFDSSNFNSTKEMSDRYREMKVADTVQTKFKAKVVDVCKAKGCWMKLQLEHGKEAMVRFKDYGFFVPKDITGKEVIVGGLAFVEEMSIDDQRHYALDTGKSKEEIEEINRPLTTFGFEAEGVLLLD
ncbi:DUF4920 domain-containing protein [Pseudozobellia sp. WGM2]|uniref:DUF4920 domain-containing protein n=1 Tax=Pseudozobellia sp. WGM2 TaxID=2787625 RepID=UPI001AE038FC|nr:DUF4920 domain-containing protein [Pseudozobellia sp. WGM2]